MANSEHINYKHTPREVAQIFYTRNFRNDPPLRNGPRADNVGMEHLAGHTWRNMNDEQITDGDKVKFLAGQPLIFAVLVIADVETGFTPEQERFILHTSATLEKVQIETDILRYETDGNWQYGNLDTLRSSNKTVETDEQYLEALNEDLVKLEELFVQLKMVAV